MTCSCLFHCSTMQNKEIAGDCQRYQGRLQHSGHMFFSVGRWNVLGQRVTEIVVPSPLSNLIHARHNLVSILSFDHEERKFLNWNL
jgi:hypothetical protein